MSEPKPEGYRPAFAELMDDARQLRAEIEHVEAERNRLTFELCSRETEAKALHAELAALRNALSAMHAEAAERRESRAKVIAKRDDLDTAIAECGAFFAEKALMRQQLAHLWTLADKAIGGGS